MLLRLRTYRLGTGLSEYCKYHKDIDAVVIQFTNTTGGYNWNTSEIAYNRIVKILRRKKKLITFCISNGRESDKNRLL